MFQNPINQTYTGMDATLEIVIMLLGAFILGYLVKSFFLMANAIDVRDGHRCKNWEKCKNCAHCNGRAENVTMKENVKTKPDIFVTATPKEVATPTATTSKNTAMPIATGSVSGKDNLKIIEGIGPKVEELLSRNNIRSFSDLESLPYEKLSQILRQENGKFQMLLISAYTWSKQASIAKDGDMEALKKYQDTLSSGRV